VPNNLPRDAVAYYTTLFLLFGGKWLLLKRSAEKRFLPSRYTGLGGRVEADELTDLRRSVLRELYEETGLAEADLGHLTLRRLLTHNRPGEPLTVTAPPTSTSAQLQSQAQREAEALATQQRAQSLADAAAAQALEDYQAAQRRADEAARAHQAEAAALRMAEVRTEASRKALSRYLGSVYRTGVGNRRLSVLNDLIDARDPQALFTGLSMASRVGGNRNDQLAALRDAQDLQSRAAQRAEQAQEASEALATAAATAKAEADRAVADQKARVAAAVVALATTQQRAAAASAREQALAQAELIARSRSAVLPIDALLGAAVVRPEATCKGASTAGFPNGQIPIDVLCPLWGTSGQILRADAAAAFNALSRKYAETFRAPICVTDSYRDYPSQVAVRAAKPTLAAVPGTSNHGWGVAVDLCDGVQVFGSPQHEWLKQHAMAYGWFHPSWAQPGGSKPEPWHWEYAG